MKKKSASGENLFRALSVVLAVVTGAVASALSFLSLDVSSAVLRTLITAAFILVAFFIQLIIHEAGHLVFGLLTGYSFSSFRILSFMLKKEDGRIVLRKLNLSGTAGQCLMGPPEPVDGRVPYVLYNLGGVLMNLISAALSVFICLLLGTGGRGWYFFAVLAVVGIYLALTNGIPSGMGAVPNDGYNAAHLGKDPEAVDSFWKQLKISQQQGEGIRLKDMPDEWFSLREGADLNNPLIAAIAVFGENRAMDSKDFEKAGERIRLLCSEEVSIAPLYRALLVNDAVFPEVLEKGGEVDLSAIREKDTAAILKQMRAFPSVIRTEYAVAALAENDRAKADSAMTAFEKTAKSYPNPIEIESERELIGLVGKETASDA